MIGNRPKFQIPRFFAPFIPPSVEYTKTMFKRCSPALIRLFFFFFFPGFESAVRHPCGLQVGAEPGLGGWGVGAGVVLLLHFLIPPHPHQRARFKQRPAPRN